MAHKYNLTPKDVPQVCTKHRCIKTQIPVPESLEIFERLSRNEPISMQGQPPIIWDKAEDFYVFDKWGNKWLDWSSCVLVANAGHARKEILDALRAKIDQKLLSTYVFAHEDRAELCSLLAGVAPEGLDKVFLLSTGSEATENAVKLARTYGIKKGGRDKHIMVSFDNSFHGRTLGAQMIGGLPGQQDWVVELPGGFVHVPFPDGFRNEDVSFELFEKTLADAGVDPKNVAGVISESYQGIGPNFLPVDYAQKLEKWCRANDAVLIMDEVQAGFGRTGKFFCFEHYGITPDLICCGKGISSSLPLSAVIGREEIMNLYAPGSMTSTHSASPLPTAAAIANVKLLLEEKLTEQAAEVGKILSAGLEKLVAKYPKNIGVQFSKGLVGGLLLVKPGTKDPDSEMALAINEKCLQKGLLMFAPVGLGGGCVKIAPPLNTPADALEEGIAVLTEACNEVLG